LRICSAVKISKNFDGVSSGASANFCCSRILSRMIRSLTLKGSLRRVIITLRTAKVNVQGSRWQCHRQKQLISPRRNRLARSLPPQRLMRGPRTGDLPHTRLSGLRSCPFSAREELNSWSQFRPRQESSADTVLRFGSIAAGNRESLSFRLARPCSAFCIRLKRLDDIHH
jgi:hypothetical protein